MEVIAHDHCYCRLNCTSTHQYKVVHDGSSLPSAAQIGEVKLLCDASVNTVASPIHGDILRPQSGIQVGAGVMIHTLKQTVLVLIQSLHLTLNCS